VLRGGRWRATVRRFGGAAVACVCVVTVVAILVCAVAARTTPPLGRRAKRIHAAGERHGVAYATPKARGGCPCEAPKYYGIAGLIRCCLDVKLYWQVEPGRWIIVGSPALD
jgi:hypothetical protein